MHSGDLCMDCTSGVSWITPPNPVLDILSREKEPLSSRKESRQDIKQQRPGAAVQSSVP